MRTLNVLLRYVLVGAMAALIGCSHSTDKLNPVFPPDESTHIQLDKGELVGFLAPNSARVWRGIPFAAPPIGDLRWKAPQQAPNWASPLQATKHAHRCMQYTNSLDKLEGTEPDVLIGSEDCLYLDIYAPSKTPPLEGWPVMVWIHGGSNTWGGANQYDGSVLAERQNVIVVVPQFRLGPLGWFAHPALNNDANGRITETANFALLDIMASLKWLKKYIPAFGGDEQNVTLFGESAGAFDIYALFSMVESKDLFNKAIVQSGAAHSDSLESAQQHEFSGENVIRKLVNKAQPSAADIRNIPVDVLYKHYKTGGKIQLPVLIADGITIPKEGVRFFLKNHWAEVGKPIIIGSNKDEAKFYFAFEPVLVKQVLGFYPYILDEELYAGVSDYVNKMWRILVVNTQAQELASAADYPVFTYRFDWDDEESFYGVDIKQLIGTSHTVEIPFVFGTFDNFMGKLGEVLFVEENNKNRQILSAQMMSYWTQFAYHSDPSDGREHQLPKWPSVNQAENKAMILDSLNDKGLSMYEVSLSIEELFAKIKQDPRLKDKAKRCFVATQMAKFSGEIDARIPQFKKESCQK